VAENLQETEESQASLLDEERKNLKNLEQEVHFLFFSIYAYLGQNFKRAYGKGGSRVARSQQANF
jgi:hypothetical protein